MKTNLYAPFIIHDFEKSWNNQIISEEECAANKDTLIGQPVLVKEIRPLTQKCVRIYKPIELLETPKANQTTTKIPVDNKDI